MLAIANQFRCSRIQERQVLQLGVEGAQQLFRFIPAGDDSMA